jgi:hypothetical protein
MLRTEVGCPARRGEEREREGGGVVAGVLGRRRGRRREVTMRERGRAGAVGIRVEREFPENARGEGSERKMLMGLRQLLEPLQFLFSLICAAGT